MDLDPMLMEVLSGLGPLFDDAVAFARDWSRPELLIAFLAGAGAVLSGGRLLVLAAGLLIGADLATRFGYLEIVPAWLFPLCVLLGLVGIVQAVITTLADEQTANTAILVAVVAIIAFTLWKGPAAIVSRILRRRA